MNTTTPRVRELLHHLDVTDRRAWLTAFTASAALFAVTGRWYGVTNIDVMAAAWPAWNFAHTGTFWLEGTTYPDLPWFSEVGGHVVSNRMAGVVLASVPAQLLLAPLDVHPLTPAQLTAVLATAGAMANLLLLLRRLLLNRGLALAVTTVMALGTGVWTNASAELWPHGPNLLWLTCAMLLAHRGLWWWCGAALVPAIWTRPHLVVVAAALGLVVSARSRRWQPALAVGLTTGAGVAGLVLWNHRMFGASSLGGGYAGKAELLATPPTGSAAVQLLESIAGSLFSPLHGLVPLSPFLLVGALALALGLRRVDAWAQGAAVGGLLYLAVQWRLNSFTGGTGIYGYRLQLETLVLCTPVAAVGYRTLAARSAAVRLWARGLSGLSVSFSALGMFWYQPMGERGVEQDPWTTWGPLFASTYRGAVGTVVAVVVVAASVVVPVALVRRTAVQEPEMVELPGVPGPQPRRVDLVSAVKSSDVVCETATR